MINIRRPQVSTEDIKSSWVASYLYELADSLNFALRNITSENLSGDLARKTANADGGVGWVTLPDGTVICYGKAESTNSVVFPKAVKYGSAPIVITTPSMTISTTTTAGFMTSASGTFNWIAIGRKE